MTLAQIDSLCNMERKLFTPAATPKPQVEEGTVGDFMGLVQMATRRG